MTQPNAVPLFTETGLNERTLRRIDRAVSMTNAVTRLAQDTIKRQQEAVTEARETLYGLISVLSDQRGLDLPDDFGVMVDYEHSLVTVYSAQGGTASAPIPLEASEGILEPQTQPGAAPTLNGAS